MAKTLCDLKSLRKRKPAKYAKLVCDPRFLCRKCGRVANAKKSLCKAMKLDKE